MAAESVLFTLKNYIQFLWNEPALCYQPWRLMYLSLLFNFYFSLSPSLLTGPHVPNRSTRKAKIVRNRKKRKKTHKKKTKNKKQKKKTEREKMKIVQQQAPSVTTYRYTFGILFINCCCVYTACSHTMWNKEHGAIVQSTLITVTAPKYCFLDYTHSVSRHVLCVSELMYWIECRIL